MTAVSDQTPRLGRSLWRFGLVLLAVALVLGLPYLQARWSDEGRTYRHVALALDLEEWADLAHAHGGDLRAFLAQNRAAGVGMLALKEVRVRRLELEGRVTLFDPLVRPVAPAGLPFTPSPGYVYLSADDPAIFDLLATNLPRGLARDAVTVSAPWIAVRAEAQTLRDVRVGFSPYDVALARELGYDLMLRPVHQAGVDPASRFPAGIQAGAVVMFHGSDVLGVPDRIGETAAVMRARGLILGVIETPVQLGLYDQRGLVALLRELDYRAVRIHAFTEPELKKLVPADLVDRSMRAVRDRGIGVLYLKAIPPQVEQTAWAEIAQRGNEYYSGLAAALSDQRYTVGPPVEQRVPEARLNWIVGLLGATGGALLLLGAVVGIVRVGPRTLASVALLALAAAPAGVALARLLGGRELALEFLALMISLIVPAAAAAAGMHVLTLGGCPWRRGLLALAAMTGLGLVGGLLVAATLGGPLYTLEVRYFRGVKLAHLVPPAIALVLGLLAVWRGRERARPSLSRAWGLLAQLGRSPVTWVAAASVGLAGLGVLMILGRSGHTAGFQVSSVEVALRDLFDVRLFARPRFKEIFLGHPAVLFMSLFHLLPGGARGRDWLFPFGLAAATIGQVSIVNSFSHIRTPLIVSLVRSINGLWTGLIIAVVGYFAVLWLIRICRWVFVADSTHDAVGPLDV